MSVPGEKDVLLLGRHKITVPGDLIEVWEKTFGYSDLVITLSQIQNALRMIDAIQGVCPVEAIPTTLGEQISNPEFLVYDLGKFIQVAILIGREVSAEKFFRGSEADCDLRYPVKVTSVLGTGWNDRRYMMCLKCNYLGDTLTVVKEAGELLNLLY